jgi:hypothetical protein
MEDFYIFSAIATGIATMIFVIVACLEEKLWAVVSSIGTAAVCVACILAVISHHDARIEKQRADEIVRAKASIAFISEDTAVWSGPSFTVAEVTKTMEDAKKGWKIKFIKEDFAWNTMYDYTYTLVVWKQSTVETNQ